MLYFPDIKFDDIGDMVCVFQYFQIVATRTSDTQCPVETSGCIHRLTMGAGAVIFMQLGSNRPSPEQGILVVWSFFFWNSSMESAKNSYRVVGR